MDPTGVNKGTQRRPEEQQYMSCFKKVVTRLFLSCFFKSQPISKYTNYMYTVYIYIISIYIYVRKKMNICINMIWMYKPTESTCHPWTTLFFPAVPGAGRRDNAHTPADARTGTATSSVGHAPACELWWHSHLSSGGGELRWVKMGVFQPNIREHQVQMRERFKVEPRLL